MSAVRSLHSIYKIAVSPFLGNVCRFTPHCSDYACEAIERHGVFAGTRLTVGRLLRCNPWNSGGLDPVPPLRMEVDCDGLKTR